MPASLHDAYLQAAFADSALRSAASQQEQALAVLGVHPVNALHQSSSVPVQHGQVNQRDFGASLNNVFLPPGLQSDYNEAGFVAAQQQVLQAQLMYEAAVQNLRNCQVHEDRQALLASLPAWNTPLGPLQADTQALHPFLPQHLGGLRPQLQQQPQQRRRGRRGGVRQHAYRNGQALANRPGGPRPPGQAAQAQAGPQVNGTPGDQQTAAAAITGGTGVFLPNRPQPPPRRPTPSVPTSAPVPLSRAQAISKARMQAAANMVACAQQQQQQPAATYIPTSTDLAASVRLAAAGQLVHSSSSLPSSAYFMQDPFLSGNSSMASTIYTPTVSQDMQGLINQLSGATMATGTASPRLLTPMTTPRACEATTAALRELIYPSSEESSHSSANDLMFPQDAAALLARASAGGNMGTSHSMLNLYNMRTSVAEAPPRASTVASAPSSGGEVFGQLWNT